MAEPGRDNRIYGSADHGILSPGRELYAADTKFPPHLTETNVGLTIEENGRASACHVLKPSAEPELDNESCRIAASHFWLAPHTNGPVTINLRVRAPYPGSKQNYGGTVPLSPEDWIDPDDYPPSALAAGHGGAASVIISVSPTGNVERCALQASTGDAALDDATCKTLIRRASFLPALDAKGQPREAQVEITAHWQVPEEGGGKMQVMIDRGGPSTVCRVQYRGRDRELKDANCADLMHAITQSGGSLDGRILIPQSDLMLKPAQ